MHALETFRTCQCLIQDFPKQSLDISPPAALTTINPDALGVERLDAPDLSLGRHTAGRASGFGLAYQTQSTLAKLEPRTPSQKR